MLDQSRMLINFIFHAVFYFNLKNVFFITAVTLILSLKRKNITDVFQLDDLIYRNIFSRFENKSVKCNTCLQLEKQEG